MPSSACIFLLNCFYPSFLRLPLSLSPVPTYVSLPAEGWRRAAVFSVDGWRKGGFSGCPLQSARAQRCGCGELRGPFMGLRMTADLLPHQVRRAAASAAAGHGINVISSYRRHGGGGELHKSERRVTD